MPNLTPYDTGVRLEPHAWIGSHLHTHDDYGKVDFENDESATEITLYIERADDGELEVHIYNHGSSEVRVVIEEE